MGLPRPGLLIGSGLLAATGLFFLTFTFHWFPLVMLALGIVGVGLSFVPGDSGTQFRPEPRPAPQPPAKAAAASPPGKGAKAQGEAALRAKLRELERMRGDGTVSAAEAKRLRAELLQEWGHKDA